VVFPADAQAFRRRCPGSRQRARPPRPHEDVPQNGVRRALWASPGRRRGGVPLYQQAEASLSQSSLPTRGCSARRSDLLRTRGVLPADAGVFRTTRSGRGRPRRPPR
jgi:hypothetical protein